MSSVGSCGRRGPACSPTRKAEVAAAVGLEKNAWSTLAWAAASAHCCRLKSLAVAAHSRVAARRASRAASAMRREQCPLLVLLSSVLWIHRTFICW
jgi:hypothetical protein